MAIYYVDPYLDAPIGGINGSNNPSARLGTWADPFNMTDVWNNASNSISSINGINFVDGDEIRFKGLASIDDFVYANIRTTYGNSTYIRNVPEIADQTALTNWKSSLNTLHSSTNRGIYFVSDTDHSWLYDNISGTSIPKGLLLGQTSSSVGTNQIYINSSVPHNVIFGAFAGTKNLYLKLLKPDYHIKLTIGNNFLNIAQYVTYSAGWTSETTQDGQTVLPLLTSYSTANYGYNTDSSTHTFNLERMHLCRGSYQYDYQSVTNYYFRCLKSNITHTIGSMCSTSVNSWSYFYFNPTNARTDCDLNIGSFSDNYIFLYSNAAKPSCNLNFANYVGGRSPYMYMSTGDIIYFGNTFIYSQYSGNALIYFGSSTTSSTLGFLSNSYLFGYSFMPILTNATVLLSLPTTVYTYIAPEFSSVMLSANSGGEGPVFVNIIKPYQTSTSTTKVLLNPTNFSQSYGVSAIPINYYLSTYNYGQINTDLGVLDTQGVDYRSTDSAVKVYTTQYTNGGAQYWSDTNYTFGSNNYDKKPIGVLVLQNQLSSGSSSTLICYNDNSNNLVVQCNAKANLGASYVKKISLGYPDIVGKTSVTVSLKVSKNIDFSGASATVYLLYTNASGSEAYATLSNSYDAGTLTYTLSTSLSVSNMLSNSCHLGLNIYITNPSTASYTQKYTIKDLQVTIT